MKQYLLAHDLGTSGNKATLFCTDGTLEKSTILMTHGLNRMQMTGGRPSAAVPGNLLQ